MISLLNFLQRKLRPDLNGRSVPTRYLLMSDVVGVLYSLPLLLLGLLWLSINTEWSLFLRWEWIIIVMLSIIVFSRLRFFMIFALHSGHMVGSDGDFVAVILWASMLVFGYGIIWLFLLWILVELFLACRKSINSDMRWNSIRSASLNGASVLIPALISLSVYENSGGAFPIQGLTINILLPALAAVLTYAILYFVTWLPFILYVVWVQRSKFNMEKPASLFWFTIATMELPFLSLPFGVLASGIYVEHGPLMLGIYFLGLLFMALLANQLSRSAAKSRNQTIQLMGLERLGRDILAAPTDARELPGLLRKHIPDMFPCRRAAVWLAPETYLLKYPDGKDNYTPNIWDWLLTKYEPQGFVENEPLPWENAPERHFALLAAPILDPSSEEPLGGVFIELLSLPQSWDLKTLRQQYPALQTLASQIATALQQAETYQETINNKWVAQELRLAGDIQSSFLPERDPSIKGWDIASNLVPARETSGDFYDFFQLGDGRLGFIIADVADKGLGAALYMALGRTLILTYAQIYPENPAAVLQATNQRMLSDARAQMFITAFYGVLEPEIGRLIYCNAGHHPPLLIRSKPEKTVYRLNPNGMALGIDENAAWVAVSQKIGIEDTLLLYTDGVVESNDSSGSFYGLDRLEEKAKGIANRPSQWIIRAIKDDVSSFRGEATQSDDMTMVCIQRRA
jgi:serine phosphatase RsbU (regulator of sigma subunit)